MKRPSPAEIPDSPDLPPPAPPPPHRRKKTRELPNLSDCHCCNRRINITNPKNRLQILSSEWRIVLLCKCCYNLVESSQYCSYCLSRVSSSPIEAFHQCSRCRRRVHKSCASMFAVDSGNSGSCGSSNKSCDEFSVCFDCWVPRLLENDYKARVLRSVTAKSKVVKVSGGLANSLGSSGVCDSQELGRGEDVLNDVQVVAQKKVAAAKDAKEKAIDKEIVSKKAVVLASNGLGLVAVGKDGGNQQLVVDEDAQLAFRLHRAMNSSPRILRNSCLLNTHCVDVPEANGCSDGLGSWAPAEPSYSSKPDNVRDDEQNGLSETRQDGEQKCVGSQDEKQSGESDGCLITYCRKERTSLKVKGLKEVDFSQRTLSLGSSERLSGDVRFKEESDCPLRTYRRGMSKVKRCKLDRAHCSKTYSRRHSVILQRKAN